MSPAAATGLGLGLYSSPLASVTSSSSAAAAAGGGGGLVAAAGLNAAAAELARLGDRAAAAACVGPSPALTPWSLPPFTVDTPPSQRLGCLDRNAATDDQQKNLDDYYVNRHRYDVTRRSAQRRTSIIK